MRVSSCVALSEAGAEGPGDLPDDDKAYDAAEMARTSVELRQAARTMTRLRLSWPNAGPRAVLIVTKEHLDDKEQDLMEQTVGHVRDGIHALLPEAAVTLYRPGMAVLGVDCVVTLGGDGTVLHAAWLFQQVVPPILSFHLGTLGFLTVYEYNEDCQRLVRSLKTVLCPGADRRLPRVLLRMRLNCQIVDDVSHSDDGGAEGEVSGWQEVSVWQVLNEVSIERGSAGLMASLEVHVDGKWLTTANADGLLVATPTGSTAYSLSAGGSVVHPSVPGILLTPVSPHSLSFRPILLPDSAALLIRVGDRSRSSAWVSFDGRCRVELQRGQAIRITASPFPVPTVCRTSQSDDWFTGLANCFRWASR